MLVLTRRINESIVLNDDIVVKILGKNGNHIMIGIDAPSDVKVFREEIYKKIQEQNKLEIGE